MKLIFAFLITLLLSACSQVLPLKAQEFPIVQNKQAAWLIYQRQQQKLNHWHLTGLLGVRLPKTAKSANFIWQQSPAGFNIELYGPFGLGATYLIGKSGHVKLKTHDGKVFKADSAQDLMQETLGWSVPVKGLLYWIKGIPMPNMVAKYSINKFGFLAQLQQNGWKIIFSNYRTFKNYILPTKLKLSRNDLNITILINGWGYINNE